MAIIFFKQHDKTTIKYKLQQQHKSPEAVYWKLWFAYFCSRKTGFEVLGKRFSLNFFPAGNQSHTQSPLRDCWPVSSCHGKVSPLVNKSGDSRFYGSRLLPLTPWRRGLGGRDSWYFRLLWVREWLWIVFSHPWIKKRWAWKMIFVPQPLHEQVKW